MIGMPFFVGAAAGVGYQLALGDFGSCALSSGTSSVDLR